MAAEERKNVSADDGRSRQHSVFTSYSPKSPETKARRQLIRILKESLIPHSASETRWRENLGPGGGDHFPSPIQPRASCRRADGCSGWMRPAGEGRRFTNVTSLS